MRSPHLYETLRRFCLGAFAAFHKDLETGADLPFAFEEHGSYGRPTLYEYRPLVRGFVEARAERLASRDDVRLALEELRREPAAAIFAPAHAGPRPDAGRALYTRVPLPPPVRPPQGGGGDRRRGHRTAARDRGARRGGPGPVRAARLAAVRRAAGVAHRRDAAGWGADAAGRVSRCARGGAAAAARPCRRGGGARRGA